MALPHRTTGSLGPAFASARLAGLTVRLPSTLALSGGFPSHLREPLGASVTFWEATAPVKLPIKPCPRQRVRNPDVSGWYLTVASTETKAPASQAPTYPAQKRPNLKARLQ